MMQVVTNHTGIEFEATLRCQCALCGRVADQLITVLEGEDFILNPLPPGWQRDNCTDGGQGAAGAEYTEQRRERI